MCQVCTRLCTICDRERCSKCCVEEFVPPTLAFDKRTGLLICRGEEGDPVCLICLEDKNDDDRASDGNEMAHNTE
jgi:hypothetical protein